jgi:hypothetical protein
VVAPNKTLCLPDDALNAHGLGSMNDAVIVDRVVKYVLPSVDSFRQACPLNVLAAGQATEYAFFTDGSTQ